MSDDDRFSRTTLLLAVIGSALAAAGIGALLVTIVEHEQEEKRPFFQVVELTDETTDPAEWGRNFPIQYDSYRRTVDQVRTRYGGSEAVPRAPTEADPRSVVSQSRIEEDPRLKTMWAGYAFAKDFREERGHAYMLVDQIHTERQEVVQQPGTCLHCHASVYVPYKKAGGGDLMAGFEKLNAMTYQEAVKLVEHPVSCIDCHDPASMRLRVTRPGFLEGMKALKASEGVSDYDVNRDASRQEMRSFVCGQCHVEYYFKGPEKRLTYPWHRGLKVEEIYSHYAETGFKDWTHAVTGAPVLKAQHPEFEMFSQGTHSRAGVACADCHMPYERTGAAKVSSHHVRSPLLSIERSCGTCHPVAADELRARAESNQARTMDMRDRALDALVALISDLEAARAAGRADADLAPVHELQRRAQFYLDFVEAENSIGFHAPAESVRILGESIDYSRQAQVLLRDPTFVPRVTGAAQVVAPAPGPAAGSAPATGTAPATGSAPGSQSGSPS